MADLTGKQQAFIDHYILCNFNATEAAIAAGYSERSARSIGQENLTKPDILEAIKVRVAERAMGADEVLLRLADQGRSTMDDFLTLRPTRMQTTITKPVGDVIADLEDQIEFEEIYAIRAGLVDKELEAHQADIARIRRRITRLEIRLERDPNATEDVPGPMVEQLVPDVDLAKAAARGKLHLVKSFNAKDGKIELYDAHAGLVDIGKHHGLFKDVTEIQLDWDKLTEEELERIRNGEDPKKVVMSR